VANLLTYWAMRSALDISAICAAQPMPGSRQRRQHSKYEVEAASN
jgi:hypothetical protein